MSLERRFLDCFEEDDARSLAWGICDIQQSLDHYRSLAIQYCERNNIDQVAVDEHLKTLIESRALIRFSTNDSAFFRTRMAHTVFLQVHLKQLLPKNTIFDAGSLVSDFRFVRKPREVPRRNLGIDTLLSETSGIEPQDQKFLAAFFRNNPKIESLSGFQTRAAQQILATQNSGVVITAGTGSGKTLAFYLPMLSRVARSISLDHSQTSRVRAIAIYPRIELLKDQLMETLAVLREFNNYLRSEGLRPITVGAFYGDIPQGRGASDKFELARIRKNRKVGFAKCLIDACSGNLVWRDSDREKGIEVAVCNQCGDFVHGDEFLITRKRIQESPPDILFVTTEMVSQHLTRPLSKKLFGIVNPGLEFVLMDEVHTYEGIEGAQTALLLRRWANLIQGKRPKFVGLSATLEEPLRFFSELTGIREAQISHVAPKDDELEAYSSEYMLVLRGDPVSKKALLSTAIQSLMLSVRAQDSASKIKTNITWPPKVFAFTDDLDVVNRLFYDYVNAEGWRADYGKIENLNKKSLAVLRDPMFAGWDQNTAEQAFAMGQDWNQLKANGYSLSSDDIVFDQVSSHNSGVNPSANVVVATSALEVGFNDPSVGVVLQYKTPVSISSFVQRKGRAGRQIDSRPWTVVVLSEFSRDRDTFQRFEELANPVLKGSYLPLDNQHVLKMQASSCVLDWIAKRESSVWVYHELRSGGKQIETIKKHLVGILQDSSTRDELALFIQRALGVNDETLNEIFWSSPRSLILDFIPSLLREIQTDFEEFGELRRGLVKRNSPSPGFITGSLFDSLNTPTTLIIPPGKKDDGDESDIESMDLFHALREFAPGKISKRYIKRETESWWVFPELNDWASLLEKDGVSAGQKISLMPSDICSEYDVVTSVKEKDADILIIRPRVLTPKLAPTKKLEITDKSFGQMLWSVLFRKEREERGSTIVFLNDAPGYVERMQMTPFLHNQGLPVEIVRYAKEAEANLVTLDKQSRELKFDFIGFNEESIGLGASSLHDALRLSVKIKTEYFHSICDLGELSKIRPVLYKRLLKTRLTFLNQFDIDWLVDCFFGLIAYVLMDNPGYSLYSLCEDLLSDPSQDLLQDIPNHIFHRANLSDQDEASLQADLSRMLGDEGIVRQIAQTLLEVLEYKSLDVQRLIRDLAFDALAGLLNRTVLSLIPDLSDRDIVVDIGDVEENGDFTKLELWVSETDPGGSGFLSQLFDRVRVDPSFFMGVWLRYCEETEEESIGLNLGRLILMSKSEEKLSKAFSKYRDSKHTGDKKTALRDLSSALLTMGLQGSQSLLNVLQLRILRPGSDLETDRQVLELYNAWDDLIERAGFELPLKSFAFGFAFRDSQDSFVYTRMNHIIHRLYPRGYDVRRHALSYYNRFYRDSEPDRTFVEGLFAAELSGLAVVDLNDWESFRNYLSENRKVELFVSAKEDCDFSLLISKALLQQITLGGFVLFPRVESVIRRVDGVSLRFSIAELY